MKTKTYESTEKKLALSKALECEIHELKVSCYDSCLFELGDKEFLVCTEYESYEKSEEYIRDTLWAFIPTFVKNYIPSTQGMTSKEESEFLEILQQMQEKMCESCNKIIEALIGDRLEDLIKDSIANSGTAPFLANYDHEEIRQDEFYIYRVN